MVFLDISVSGVPPAPAVADVTQRRVVLLPAATRPI